jgi:WhiB family redox-sensing transcriptional regulator
MPAGEGAQTRGRSNVSSLETFGFVHPDERERNFLTAEGNRAVRFLHARGACRDLTPRTFFPEKGEPAEPAYAVCVGCEVRTECLAFALKTVEREGIWGATNEKIRRGLLRRVRAGEALEDVAASYVPPALCVGQVVSTGRQCKRRAQPGSTLCGPHGIDNARRTHGTEDTLTMTDDEVARLVENAVAAATAGLIDHLVELLADTTARLDALTTAMVAGFEVLAPLDEGIADAAAMARRATGDE